MKQAIVKEYFENIGDFLKSKRVKKNLSQIEVAKILDCKSQFISNWERGLCRPPWGYMKTIVRLYNVPEREIMTLLMSEHEKVVRKSLGFKSKRN